MVSLCKHPSQSSLTAFDRVIADAKIYYQIRCMAVTSLASIAMTSSALKDEAVSHLIAIFETKFCLPRARPNDPLVVRPNQFDNFANYFLQKSIPDVLSRIKTDGGKCPFEIQRFLLQLLRFNDNTTNAFSDTFYVAGLVSGLAESLIPATADPRCKPDTILLKDAIAELERYRFLDLVEPSYQNQVTLSILQATAKLQHAGLLQVDPNLFWQYWKPQNNMFVRQAAVEILLLLSGPGGSSGPSQMSQAEIIAHLFKWLLFIRNDRSSVLSGDASTAEPLCHLGPEFMHTENAHCYYSRPLLIRLMVESLKKTFLLSTKLADVLRTDETCKFLLKLLLKKALCSGKLDLIEPLLLMSRLGLPPAPIPELS